MLFSKPNRLKWFGFTSVQFPLCSVNATIYWCQNCVVRGPCFQYIHPSGIAGSFIFEINRYFALFVCVHTHVYVCKIYTKYIHMYDFFFFRNEIAFAFQELLKDFPVNSPSRWVSLNCPDHSFSNQLPGPIWGEKGRHMRNLFLSNPLCKASAKTSFITMKAVNG